MNVLRGTARAPDSRGPVELTAVPFYAWDNRTPGEMAVWVREEPGQ
jgi:DUF1680 family protein